MSPLPSAQDRALCRRVLPEVSRTFALSIEALPEGLRRAVRTAYLLCRIVDGLEDDATIAPDERAGLFHCFDRTLTDERRNPAELERRCTQSLHGLPTAELELCRQAGAVLRCFWALPSSQQRAIGPRVLKMSSGMLEYASRERSAGLLCLTDQADLERYCYFVAGTVGELLTDLFLDFVGMDDAPTRAALEARAVSFGLGLQMVNIVKDVAEDHDRGVCYLPSRLLRQHGVEPHQVLHPSQRAGALAALRQICARARSHLLTAQQYTLLWPYPAGDAVRLFCAVPLALAHATLTAVEQGDDALRPGHCPKISHTQLADILADTHAATSDDHALLQVFHRSGAPPAPMRAARSLNASSP